MNEANKQSNLNRMLDVLKVKCPTNRHILKALLISAFCTHDDFKYKLHVFINGEYALGKTFICTLVRELLPIDNIVTDDGKVVPKISPKYVFYSTLNGYYEGKGDTKVFKPKPVKYANRIAYLDDVQVSLTEALKDLTNTSGDVPTHSVPYKSPTGMSTRTMRLDGKPTIWCTKVEGLTDTQVTSRFYKIEGEKQVKTVHETIMRNMSCDGYTPEQMKEQRQAEYNVSKFIAKRISKHCEFKIPLDILKLLPVPENNRNSDFMIIILKAIAKINSKDISVPIVPTEGDIFETISMFQDKTACIQTKGYSDKAEKVLEYLSREDFNPSDVDESYDPPGQTINNLLTIAGIGYKHVQLTAIINELEAKGLIEVTKNRYQKKYFRRID